MLASDDLPKVESTSRTLGSPVTLLRPIHEPASTVLPYKEGPNSILTIVQGAYNPR